MTKRTMLILLVLSGTSFLLIRLILPQQQFESPEKPLPAKPLEVPFDLRVVKHNHNQVERVERLPDDEHQKTDHQSIRKVIIDIEAELKNEQILESLNANKINTEERARIGQKLQNLDHLRAQDLKHQLVAIEKDVAALALTIPERLRKYVVAQP
jgi:hypothetical protein